MRTEKQLAASRANGAKSRGPVTAEGKSVSSQNALKSGLYSKSPVIRGEDLAEFQTLAESLYQSLRPADADQEALVITLIRTQWLLNRLHRVENAIWEYQTEEADRYNPANSLAYAAIASENHFLILQRRLDSANRTYLRTRELLSKLQKQNPPADPAPQPSDSTLETVASGSFDHPAPFPALDAPQVHLTPPSTRADDQPQAPLTPPPTPAADPPQPAFAPALTPDPETDKLLSK